MIATQDNWIRAQWPAPAGVHALTTTRLLPGNSRPPFDALNLGLHSGEARGVVEANRALLQRALQLPQPPRWLDQVHGNGVVNMDEQQVGELTGDAAVSRRGDQVLAVLSADCLPVVLCSTDSGQPAIAAAHAGWRGLSAGVLEAAVDAMGVAPEKLLAWFGPAIASPSYEVGEQVRAAFVGHDGYAAEAFVPTRPGHWQCDLYLLARQRLSAAGLTRIHGGNFDTRQDRRFYSWRRASAADTSTGRMATLVWRSP